MNLTALHDEFGARIDDVDLSQPLTKDQFRQIDAWINQYSVLLFRDQAMSDELQLQFTRLFGVPEEEHTAYYGHGEITYLGTVGNIDHRGEKLPASNRGIRSGKGNEMWHSDSSFREVPSLHSILCAYEIPEQGGDTEFVSSRAAYKRLDQQTRNTIAPLTVIHDYIFSRTKVSEDAVNTGQRTYMYPVRQKLVRTNPQTQEKNFYIGSHARDIEGWETREARRLLDALISETTRDQSVFRHQWHAGDVLMWDNRCILHRGCGYDADKYRRYMRQTRVRGYGPTLAEE